MKMSKLIQSTQHSAKFRIQYKFLHFSLNLGTFKIHFKIRISEIREPSSSLSPSSESKLEFLPSNAIRRITKLSSNSFLQFPPQFYRCASCRKCIKYFLRQHNLEIELELTLIHSVLLRRILRQIRIEIIQSEVLEFTQSAFNFSVDAIQSDRRVS